jgi:hypothetical protein
MVRFKADTLATQTPNHENTSKTAAAHIQKGSEYLDQLSQEYKGIRITIDSLLMQARLIGIQVGVQTRREIEQASRDARIYLIRGDGQSAEHFISLLRKDAEELSSQLNNASSTNRKKASSA